MAVARVISGPLLLRRGLSPLTMMRLGALVGMLALWQAIAVSGLLFRDVVPTVFAVFGALVQLVLDPKFYGNLAVTAGEVLGATILGGAAGGVVGLLLGVNRFAARAWEPFIHYIAPTPKIVFLPILFLLFGTGPESKLAMGIFSAFFPVALSVAAGVRGVDPVLLRVARSFRLTRWQVVRMVYLPALRRPIGVGLRIGFGIAMVGCLLAELALSNKGLGYLASQDYAQFLVPQMYAVLIVIFILAALGNAAIGKLARPRGEVRR